MQNLTFVREVLHLASFWKWELFELGHAGRPHRLVLTSFVGYYEVTQETGKIRPPKQSYSKSL